MLSTSEIERNGVFRAKAVERLVHKAKTGRAIGAKDNMALVGVLSTQILVDRMIRNFHSEDAGTERLAVVGDGPLGVETSVSGIPLTAAPNNTTAH